MNCLLRAFRLLPLLLLVSVLPVEAARLALVIGNGDYLDGPLKNPVRDARAMAARLGALGFAVTKVENLKRDDIGGTVEGFAAAVRPGDDVVVYYAGHGVQVKGTNYFPAVDARIQREADVPMHSLNLNDLLDELDRAKAGVKVVLLDACRNNPYARSFRDASRGLARIANAPSGTLIHYATRPGQVAADGDGANGLYTTQLLKAMDTPGLVVELLFKQVASEVKRVSKGEQEPWVEGHLDGVFMFNPGGGRAKALPPSTIPGAANADFDDLERAQQQVVDARRKWEVWQRAMQAAFDKAAKLTATPEIETTAWERFLASHAEDNPNSAQDEQLRIEARRKLAAARGKETAEAALAPAPAVGATSSRSRTAGTVFRDCAECPEMVVIPAGRFEMGSPVEDADRLDVEGPVHTVEVQSFALGKYEVTQGEWRTLMGISPSECGEECPVQGVNWHEANAYLRKLNLIASGREDRPYRLPSEAEWEYACRGGGRHRYCGSDDVEHVAWYRKNGGGRLHRIGTKAANGFGLHDMSGNVWEWTQDCWRDGYRRGPKDGSAWTSGIDCSQRVFRGGSWINEPALVRAAVRLRQGASERDDRLGFRIARSLP
jgi:formylglycine-generating enzyme required for sulfatase activity